MRSVPAALAIVGYAGGSHVGASLKRAAVAGGHRLVFMNAYDAMRGPRVLRSLCWHLVDRRPLRLARFSAEVVGICAKARPDILIATGAVPLTGSALRSVRAEGIVCVNYATDDPWNPSLRANWHLRALPEYDFVFSPRRANIENFRQLGCSNVRWLPFGYDDESFRLAVGPVRGPAPDILFVGGADRDRVAFMSEFLASCPGSVALVGSYWERSPATRPYSLGQLTPAEVAALTRGAKVSLCLVRRANRDGHVMRSFEIAAIGGCMLAEETAEHHEIFGPDGEAITYFRTAGEAAERARLLLANPRERTRLSVALRAKVSGGSHSYRDRLLTMIQAAEQE